MNKNLVAGLLAVIAFGALISQNAFAASGITGSGHDFSGKGWGSNEICVFCHAPHNANTSVSDAPLWNHGVTSTSFTLYTSPTLQATTAQPTGVSKLCLSCHDGTVAIDSFGGNTGSNNISGDDLLGTSLANDHPVSITYNAALATSDGGLEDPTVKTVVALSGKTIDDGMLVSHKIECASCHDVHNSRGDAGTAGHLLLVNNSGSALCKTCHKK